MVEHSTNFNRCTGSNQSNEKAKNNGLISSSSLLSIGSILLLIISLASPLFAQEDLKPVQIFGDSLMERSLTIDKIFVVGNRQTKEEIITRELSVKTGENYGYGDLKEILLKDHQKINNTRLFLTVQINVIPFSAGKADIIIRVKERWYLVPSPFVNFIDRNFTAWLQNQDAGLGRVVYGFRFYKYNFRGRNERLFLFAQLGFTKRFAINYSIPYVDKSQKNGLIFDIAYLEQDNIDYRTSAPTPEEDHEFIFTQDLRRAQVSRAARVGWVFRPNFFKRHQVNLSYNQLNISDTVLELNPNYLATGTNRQRYLQIDYRFTNDQRDVAAYPVEGSYFTIAGEKLGLGIFNEVNITRLSGSYSNYNKIGKKLYFAFGGKGFVTFPGNQAYINLKGYGYNRDWSRGYETRVIQGNAYLIQQNTLRWKLFDRVFDLDNIVPIDQFNTLPFAIYLKVFADQGYVFNNDSPDQFVSTRLANRYLYGGGVGLDIVSFYDFVLRMENAWNAQGEYNFNFSLRAAF